MLRHRLPFVIFCATCALCVLVSALQVVRTTPPPHHPCYHQLNGLYVVDLNLCQIQATTTAAANALTLQARAWDTFTNDNHAYQQVIDRVRAWQPVERDFDGVTMVLVPRGCFVMGSLAGEPDERPLHDLCFTRDFWLDKTEVTNAQYGQPMGGVASQWTDPQRPRERINWYDARAHCQARGGRLPTEAEWEYAARGPDSLPYPWGTQFRADALAWAGNSGYQTAAVGSYPAGASWVGALDMAGNVWEWNSTIYVPGEPYSDGPTHENADNPASRVLRGGAWISDERGVRAANRGAYQVFSIDASVGFRCARDAG
jgi:formylglycine-generating enzyme required for sulfatase activity